LENTPSFDEPPSQSFLADLASVEPNYFYIFSFAAIAGLLLMSALISASEVAFFSLRADDLDRCRDSDDPRDRNITDLLKKPRLLLATILIMNNLVNVGVVTISTFLMWEMTGTKKPAEIIVGIVTFAATFAITFFGEIIPKVYATHSNLLMARLMGGVWKFMIKVCSPVSWLLLKMSHVVERRFEKRGYNATVEEINQALELTTDNDETTEEEKDILKGIVNFGTLTVRQVMKARVDMYAVDIDLNFRELIGQVKNSGFSRMPVFRENLDQLEGILYIKDLLPFLQEPEQFRWQKLVRPGFFVPESKKLDALLKDFQSKRVHMAVVVDEYGGTAGLVTLEDLIEEIIGEINDEFDEDIAGFTKIDDQTFVFEGKTSLHDFCKGLDINPEILDAVRGESESLGGLILELHNSMPKAGDKVVFDRFEFTVIAVDQKRIKRVRVTLQENAQPG